MKFSDGTEAKANVVGTDKQSDIAVIKVDNTSFPPLPRGDSTKLKVGELVMAVGSPLWLLSQSVTTGIISALDRNTLGINDYESFIQTDAAINRGNSGGPLIDMDGNVIGVNSAIVSGGTGNDGIGLAVPINLAHSVATMLIKDGKVHYARIGICLSPFTPAWPASSASMKVPRAWSSETWFPAARPIKPVSRKATSSSALPERRSTTRRRFRLRVATSEVAKSYEIVYLRDGKERTTKIVPAASDDKVVAEVEGRDSNEA